jgi:hypothetical protein
MSDRRRRNGVLNASLVTLAALLVLGGRLGDMISAASNPPLASQRLKEDEDRTKYQSNATGDGTDGVRRFLGVGNQIVKGEAHHQEDNQPFDPRHVGLLILPVFSADYSSTLLRVQTEASML